MYRQFIIVTVKKYATTVQQLTTMQNLATT